MNSSESDCIIRLLFASSEVSKEEAIYKSSLSLIDLFAKIFFAKKDLWPELAYNVESLLDNLNLTRLWPTLQRDFLLVIN